MKRKGFKLTVGLLMVAFFMLFAGSAIAYATDEDTRTHIDRVDISTNIDEVFGYGKENTTLGPTLQMNQTTSEPVSLKPYYGIWQRYIDDDGRWEYSGYEYFISGQWSMTIQIRVTDVAYLIDNETAVYVDGELWEVWYEEDGSYPFIVVIPSRNSSRFFIEEPAELTFHKLEKYDIYEQRVNSVIETLSVASSVEGGTKPYSYRKASGPDWLEVSNEGIISGEPTEIGTNEPLVVEVLDSNGGSKQITISVGETLEEKIIEVSTWEELEAAFQWNKPEGSYYTSKREMEYFTIRLMEDLSTNVAGLTYKDTVAKTFAIYRAYVTFDFNGHTLSCSDDISSSNYEYQFKDFIRIELYPNTYNEGSALRFVDSVGGGGIKMYSSRAYETCDLSALHLVAPENYNTDHYVYFDGGKYELEARSVKVSNGTFDREVRYRGCVIAEDVRVEINDGHFYANGEGAKFSVGDTCARELAAFGTFAVGVFNYAVPIELVIAADGSDSVVINGGIFESNGYAVHHFDDAIDQGEWGWSWGYMNFPTINGGYFIGQMGYTGHTFTYSDGTEFYNVLPATTIISENSYVIGIDKDGDRFYNLNGMTLKDLHDLQSCVVLGKETVQMKTTPVAGSYPASLIRKSNETETYTIEYKEPSWFATGGIQCVPYYKIQGWNSGVTPTSRTGKTEVTVDYSKYKHNGGVDVTLGMMYLTPWNTRDYSFENEYNVELQVLYDITDACENIHIYPVNGEFRVVKGGDFSFTLGGGGYYSHSAVLPLDVVTEPYYEVEAVYGEGIKTTYTIRDVQGDVKIWVQKGPNGPTGQLDLKLEIRDGVLTNLGRISEGEEYTLLTPAEYEEYGFTMPDGYEFVKWIVTTPTYSFSIEPGEPFTLSGAGAVIISPKYENLYNIQVINGTAYADEAHTQPISNAVDEQRVYIVADEPDEGKVFWKWDVIDGYNGIPVGEYGNAETTYYVNMDDALLEACYATPIDEVTLTILTEDIVPEAGMKVSAVEKVNRDAYTFYTLNYYDVTDGGHTVVFPEIENFEVGHTYQLETSVSKVDGYLLADIDDMTLHIEGLSESEYESVELQSVKNYENEEYKIIIHFPKVEGPKGVNVSGTITSSGSEGALVEVTLTNVKNKNISYLRVLVGNSTTYSIDGVMPGTYTLRVSKAGHAAYEATVTVGAEPITKDVTLTFGGYTVAFDANGGTGSMAAVSAGSGTYTLPKCDFTAPSGKTFKAWSVDGKEYAVGSKIDVMKNLTVTAVWEIAEKDVVTLNATELNNWTIGKSGNFTVYVNGVRVNPATMTWTSSDTSVATCVNGYLVAVGAGTATITCTRENATEATCTVTVKGLDVVTLNATELNNWTVGQSGNFIVYVNGVRVKPATMTWTSSDTSVATCVDGYLVAKGAGTATITCTRENATEAKCKVTVKAMDIVTLNAVALDGWKVGKSGYFTPYINGVRVARTKLTWKSSNTAVATCVDGYLVAKGAGTAIITCTRNNATVASCTVTVKGNDVVTLNATELTNWAVGKTGSFYAYVNGKRVGNNTMTWSSSNTAVATCEKGVLTAKGPGTAIITCTRPGATAAKCTVTVKGNDVVTLNATELTNWTVGKTGTFYAYVNGRRVGNSTMTWSSSNTAVATCENGVLVAKGKGTAVISCTRANATVATCKVTVK